MWFGFRKGFDSPLFSCSSFVLMTQTADMAERRLEMLGEFAELALTLARDLHKDALAAEDPAEKVRLAEAFHSMGRGMRQSLALHARLERDDRQLEADPRPAQDRQERRVRRKAEVKAGIERLIWTERERLEEEPYLLRVRLGSLLAAEAETEGFPDEDPQAVIARIGQMLGLSPSRPVHGAGGPSADEPMVGGAGPAGASAAPSPSSGRGPPPPRSGEGGKDEDPLFSDNDRRSSA
jgi:hypothetical protein